MRVATGSERVTKEPASSEMLVKLTILSPQLGITAVLHVYKYKNILLVKIEMKT